MKKYLILMIMCLFTVTSCKKFLVATPTDFINPDTYYATTAEDQAALAAVYDELGETPFYSNGWWQMNWSTDESQVKSQTPSINNYNTNSADPLFSQLWATLYTGIERANFLLANINKATMDQDTRNSIQGQALFLRGYYYYILVSNWGDVPLLLTPPTSVTATAVARTPSVQVYTQILADMTQAETLLVKQTASSIGYGGMVSETTVEGVLARVYLTMAGNPINDKTKYALALQYATKVVNSGQHALNPNFAQIFINYAQDLYDVKESMWEVEFNISSTGSAVSAGFIGNYFGPFAAATAVTGNCYSLIDPTGKLFYSYGVDPTTVVAGGYNQGSFDLRRDWACVNYQMNLDGTHALITNTDPDYFGVGKWRREYELTVPRQKNQSTENWPLLRYSDVLLMQAEADNEVNNGPSATAYAAINAVRRRGWGLLNGNVLKSITITNAGSGYTTAPAITFSGGGGSGAAAFTTLTSGKVTANYVTARTDFKGYYTSAPTIVIGNAWTAGTVYAVGTQVFNGNNLYTVTTAGTATATGPTQTSGASAAATTGAVFTYAGVKATATATISTSTDADVPQGLTHDQFFQYIVDERSRELCFECLRRNDLIRWGTWVSTMKNLQTLFKTGVGTQVSSYGLAISGASTNIDAHWNLWPIPIGELTTNPLLTQNPGW